MRTRAHAPPMTSSGTSIRFSESDARVNLFMSVVSRREFTACRRFYCAADCPAIVGPRGIRNISRSPTSSFRPRGRARRIRACVFRRELFDAASYKRVMRRFEFSQRRRAQRCSINEPTSISSALMACLRVHAILRICSFLPFLVFPPFSSFCPSCPA